MPLARMASTTSTMRRANTIGDRKSTRLNCHSQISYAVFCLKKKKKRALETQIEMQGLKTTEPPTLPDGHSGGIALPRLHSRVASNLAPRYRSLASDTNRNG